MSATVTRASSALAAVALLGLAACGGGTGAPRPTPDGPFGTQLGQTLRNISLPDCGDQMHDLHSYYKQRSGLLVVMTMGVG